MPRLDFYHIATCLSGLAALVSVVVYICVYYVVGMQNMTCFGGAFGVFGSQLVRAKPFIEFQVQRDVAYIFGMHDLLYEVETQYQQIEVYAHRYFGHVLVIDGSLQITERDEVNYHEMTAHVPMAYLPEAKKVLVVGGGDGGALLRLLQHPNVETAHLVDIDMFAMRNIVASYFPYLYTAYIDKRTKAFAYDGSLWVDEQLEVEDNHGSYEVVVLDSTDYGAAESLFTESFYMRLKKLMAKKSILVANVDSPSWNLDTVVAVQLHLSTIFKYAFVMQSHQPTFLSGHYAFIFCSDEVHPMHTPIDWDAFLAKNIDTYYYNEDIHYASFILPESVRKSLSQGAQLKDLKAEPFTKRVFPQEPTQESLIKQREAHGAKDDDEGDESLARDDL